MPFQIDPARHCADCPYGYCVEYVGDQEFKDRNTAFRLNQQPGWQCAFSNFVPGTEQDEYDKEYEFYINRVTANSETAGEYLFENKHWGEIDPDEFFYTAQQKGKVRGDTYEFLIRAVLWNCCAYWNEHIKNGSWKLDRPAPSLEFNDTLGVITLGDNYSIENLFTEKYQEIYQRVHEQLEEQGTHVALSTPDAVIIRTENLPDSERSRFQDPIVEIDEQAVTFLQSPKFLVEGSLHPRDVVAAIGIKSSLRSDRLYQLLFEANAWKLIFGTVFDVKAQEYHVMTGESYGASVQKLYSVFFDSIEIDEGQIAAERAVDGVMHMNSPGQTIDWFYDTLIPGLAEDTGTPEDQPTADKALDPNSQRKMDDYS